MAEYPDPEWGLDMRLFALALLALWGWWMVSLFGPIVSRIVALVQSG